MAVPESVVYEAFVAQHFPKHRLVSMEVLSGGISAQSAKITVCNSDGVTDSYIVRRHGARDIARNPNVANQEFAILTALRREDMPVPEPALVDTTRRHFPEPVILLRFVAGNPAEMVTDFSRASRALARFAAKLHSLDSKVIARTDLRTLESPTDDIDDVLAKRWLGAADVPGACDHNDLSTSTSIVHGDLWPGNVIWRSNEIASVVDWEDAAVGDPLSDVANCRLELALAWGDQAAGEFTTQYLQEVGQSFEQASTTLAKWEIAAAARALKTIYRWGLDPRELERQRAMIDGFGREAAARVLALAE